LSTPSIVVAAYNRPRALERLLRSLRRAHYPAGGRARLVISVDGADGADAANAEVRALAQDAEWPFGPKDVIRRERRLGLAAHVFACWALAEALGDLVFLEDDFVVSPAFYAYAAQALDVYRADDRVAALALYALWFNGYTHEPFTPLADGSDVFFLQVPFFQGLAFTREQAARFAAWRSEGRERPAPGDPLHPLFFKFPPSDWFPVLARYVVTTGRFVVYPRVALCLGMGDAGTHFARPTAFFQTPLLQAPADFRFRALDDSLAVYDSFFEPLPERLDRMTGALRGVEYAVDLYATKPRDLLRSACVLTARPRRAALRTFGRVLWPMEANVIEAMPGGEIALCRAEDLEWGWWADVRARQGLDRYFARGRGQGWRRRWLYRLAALASRFTAESAR